jgi:hypothetical protein
MLMGGPVQNAWRVSNAAHNLPAEGKSSTKKGGKDTEKNAEMANLSVVFCMCLLVESTEVTKLLGK